MNGNIRLTLVITIVFFRLWRRDAHNPIQERGSSYKDSVAFDILSSTIKSVYNIHRGSGDNDNIKVHPNYMSENTGKTDRRFRLPVDSCSSIDIRHYWKLSENIYRYKHWNYFEMEGPSGGIHTINKSMSISLFFKLRWLTRNDRRSGCGH